MYSLAARLNKVSPSVTLALDTKVKEMRLQGIDIISYGVGEPDFPTPENIKQKAIEAIKNNFTKYTPVDGVLDLKKAICAKFKRDNNLEFLPKEIAVSNGGKHSLFNIMSTLFQEGDEVIIPTPSWVSYEAQVLFVGARPVFVETKAEDNYNLTKQALEQAITPNTKGIILTSPSNPTGAVYTKKTLKDLASVLKKHDIWVISDDIYEKIIYDRAEFNNILMVDSEMRERTIIAHSLSKTYAMTGWRIGYCAGPEKIIKLISRFQSHATANPCSISQMAAIEALNGPQNEMEKMVVHFNERRKMAVEALNNIPGVVCPVPQGAFYLLPDISFYFGKKYKDKLIANSVDLAEYLLEEAQVAVVPGSAFMSENTIRLSYALNDKDCKIGLNRIKEALLNLLN